MALIELPVKPIAGINQNSIPENFTFVSKVGALCRCNSAPAQLLAPIIAKLLANDPTIHSFDVKVETPEDFALFRSLIETGATVVSPKRYGVYLKIARQLGNAELVQKLFAFHQFPDQLNGTNIIEE
jgi:hypothetical protein